MRIRYWSSEVCSSELAQARKSTEGRLTFEWTKVALVSDDPSKGVGKAEIKDLLFPQLMALLSKPSRSVDIVSAYFVPGKTFSNARSEERLVGKEFVCTCRPG